MVQPAAQLPLLLGLRVLQVQVWQLLQVLLLALAYAVAAARPAEQLSEIPPWARDDVLEELLCAGEESAALLAHAEAQPAPSLR